MESPSSGASRHLPGGRRPARLNRTVIPALKHNDVADRRASDVLVGFQLLRTSFPQPNCFEINTPPPVLTGMGIA